MIREIHRQFEQYTKPSALLMGAVLLGAIEVERSIRKSKESVAAGVKSYIEAEGPSIIFLRGCSEDYQVQADIYGERFKGFGSLHFPWQKAGEHSQAAIDDGIEEACERDGDRERILVPTSMGQMNMMKSLTNPSVRNALGKGNIIGIVSKSPLTSRADLQPAMVRALGFDSRTPRLSVVNEGMRLARKISAGREIAGMDQPDSDVRKQLVSSANMPPMLVRSQYAAVANTEPWEPGSHRFVTEENPNIEYFQLTGEYDRVVDRKLAHEHMENSFEAAVFEDVDHRRHYGSHADDIRYMELLTYRLALLSKTKKPLVESVINLEAYRQSSSFATAS